MSELARLAALCRVLIDRGVLSDEDVQMVNTVGDLSALCVEKGIIDEESLLISDLEVQRVLIALVKYRRGEIDKISLLEVLDTLSEKSSDLKNRILQELRSESQ